MDSHAGINPDKWGPHFWKTLFYAAMNYPVKIDPKNKCHVSLSKNYKNFYASLQYVLPCVYCLESYRRFWIELPIDNHLGSRVDLLKWVYGLKDKVNKKLIFQEKQCLAAEKKLLLEKMVKKFGPRSKWNKTTTAVYNTSVEKLSRKILKTSQSPSWNTVLSQLSDMRN